MSDDGSISADVAALIASLVQRNADNLAYTTNALLDGYRGTAETETARVAAIRAGVEGLCRGPYMPTPGAIVRALYPDEDTVDAFRPDNPHFE